MTIINIKCLTYNCCKNISQIRAEALSFMYDTCRNKYSLFLCVNSNLLSVVQEKISLEPFMSRNSGIIIYKLPKKSIILEYTLPQMVQGEV